MNNHEKIKEAQRLINEVIKSEFTEGSIVELQHYIQNNVLSAPSIILSLDITKVNRIG